MEQNLFAGKYKIEETLASEDACRILQAVDGNGQAVLIKTMNEGAGISRAAFTFKRECRFVQQLIEVVHPNIPRVYELGEGATYYVTEHVQGENIREYLAKNELSRAQIVDIALQIGQALSFIYAKFRLLHRNVHPENIILTPGLIPKLSNFGAIKAEGSAMLTKTGDIKGSQMYTDVQVVMGNGYNFHSDIYSLGLTMYYMLEKRLPMKNFAEVIAYASGGFQLQNLEDEQINRVVMKMITREAGNRFSDYPALLESLKALKSVLSPKSPLISIHAPSLKKPQELTQVHVLIEKQAQNIALHRKELVNLENFVKIIQAQIYGLERESINIRKTAPENTELEHLGNNIAELKTKFGKMDTALSKISANASVVEKTNESVKKMLAELKQ